MASASRWTISPFIVCPSATFRTVEELLLHLAQQQGVQNLFVYPAAMQFDHHHHHHYHRQATNYFAAHLQAGVVTDLQHSQVGVVTGTQHASMAGLFLNPTIYTVRG